MNSVVKINPPLEVQFVDSTGAPVVPVANGTAVVDPSAWLEWLRSAGIGSQAIKDLADAVIEEEELTADMVSYRKNVTGLDNTVFISVKFPQHGPRIKVAIDPPTSVDPMGKNASVSIDDGSVVAGKLSAGVLDQVRAFIDLNRDALLSYWEKQIDTDELRARLQPLPR